MAHDHAALLEESDAAVAYVIEAETVFNALRRLIGQLSGLLILAETKTLRNAPGLAGLAAARSQWAETEEAAARLRGRAILPATPTGCAMPRVMSARRWWRCRSAASIRAPRTSPRGI